MQRNSNGTYSYKLDPDIVDISASVTEYVLEQLYQYQRSDCGRETTEESNTGIGAAAVYNNNQEK